MGCGRENKENRSSVPARAVGCRSTAMVSRLPARLPASGKEDSVSRNLLALISDFVKSIRREFEAFYGFGLVSPFAPRDDDSV
jgi:hypothetical protein